jgi:hypothetical protein
MGMTRINIKDVVKLNVMQKFVEKCVNCEDGELIIHEKVNRSRSSAEFYL